MSIESPDKLVDKYFVSMLEREQVRQDLKMTVGDQRDVLSTIAKDMIECNYTSESREYLLTVISENHTKKLESVRQLYRPDERPSFEELVNKIVSHALLDRSSSDEQGIGFVNDFVLGEFSAENILSHEDYEWDGDARYLEPAVMAYSTRSEVRKYTLWLALRFNLNFVTESEMLFYTLRLTSGAPISLSGSAIDGIEIENSDLTKCEFNEVVFNSCVFKGTKFDWGMFKNCTLINCQFYNCTSINIAEKISLFGCTSDPERFLMNLDIDEDGVVDSQAGFSYFELLILERFWPKGRDTFHKHRPFSTLVTDSNRETHLNLISAAKSLKKKGLLKVPDKTNFLELNIEKVAPIREALGKNHD